MLQKVLHNLLTQMNRANLNEPSRTLRFDKTVFLVDFLKWEIKFDSEYSANKKLFL